MLSQSGLNNMKQPISPTLRFIAIIHWIAAVSYILVAPLLGFLGVLGSQAITLFFLPLIAGILFVVQAGLLGSDREKSTLLAIILTAYFLIFSFAIPHLDLIPYIGLSISAGTLVYLGLTKSSAGIK